MIGRYGVKCPGCGIIVAYISEHIAQQAARSVAPGFLPLDKVASTATEGAALRCVECEAKAIEAAATPKHSN